jgi:hypothetical protein
VCIGIQEGVYRLFTLKMDNWSFDAGLQIVHADVILAAEDEVIVDEPVCADVGLPALLLSALEDTLPNRWADPGAWGKMPFFVCGCGDPECRAFSFVVKHEDSATIRLLEVEERKDDTYRQLADYTVDIDKYRKAVLLAGLQFLEFVRPLDYRPYFAETVPVVTRLVEELNRISASDGCVGKSS